MALAVTSAPWQGVRMPAIDLRRYLMTLVGAEGVRLADDFKVQQHGAGDLTVDVLAGLGLVLGDKAAFQGPYLTYNDGTYNLGGFAAAHATLPRIDRVVVEVRDAAHLDAVNDQRFLILQGAPTAGATLANLNGAVAVGQNQLLIANVRIAPLSEKNPTTILTADIDTSVRPRLAAVGGREIIETKTLAVPAASIDFQNISPAYTHLELELRLRSEDANVRNVNLRCNGDAGANYDDINGLAQTWIFIGYAGSNAHASGAWGLIRIWIPWYSLAEPHSISSMSSPHYTAGGGPTHAPYGGDWRTAAAINRVSIHPHAGNFDDGTRAVLYGVRGI